MARSQPLHRDARIWPELIPTDPKARPTFEQASSVEHAHFEPISGGHIEEKMVKQFRGQTMDEGLGNLDKRPHVHRRAIH